MGYTPQGVTVASPMIPTSAPADSDRVYNWQRARQYLPIPATYAPYTAVELLPIGVTVQRATITVAPLRALANPEFHDPLAGPFQSTWKQVPYGAPPIPRSSPEYQYYQALKRTPAGDYTEIIRSYSPRVSDGNGYGL